MTCVLALSGCTAESRSPDAIRDDSAAVTRTATRDTVAVVKGLFDGLRSKGPVNINRATPEKLETLRGVDEATANRIIAGRPYRRGSDLVDRHILTRKQYNAIAGDIEAR